MITSGGDIPSVTATSTGSAATGSSELETGSSKPRYADRGQAAFIFVCRWFFFLKAMNQTGFI